MPKRGISRFSIKSLLSQTAEKLRRRNSLCLKKLLISENFMDKKGGGSAKNFREKLIVSVSKILVWEPLSLSVILGIEKTLCLRGLGQDFPSKLFCLTVPKNFVDEPFCVVEKCLYRKKLGMKEEAGIRVFRRIFFLRAKISRRGNLLCLRTFRL